MNLDTLKTLPTLTVCQPYAHLIASGVKRIENRTWQVRHRGPLLIHAGKSENFLRLMNGCDAEYGIPHDQMAFGAVVAVVDVIGCVPIEKIHSGEFDASTGPKLSEHVHAEGPFCMILGNVRRFPAPYHCPGARMIWPCDVTHRLRQLIEDAIPV